VLAGSIAVVALLSAAPAARIDAAVTASAQVGSNDPGLPGSGAGSLILEPSLAGFFEQRSFSLEAHYAPWLRLRDANSSWSFDRRQSASLSAVLRESPSLQWLASERFRYGRDELIWDPGATRPFDFLDLRPAPVPDDLFTDTELGFSLLPVRGYALSGSLGYAAYGGASALSQKILPLQQGPQLYLGLDRDLTPNDLLSGELYASQTAASNGLRSSLFKLTGGWRRQLAASTRARLVAGASASGQAGASAQASTGVHPVAAAELAHELPGRLPRLELKALAALGPHQNLLTADLVQRAELALSARLLLPGGLSVRGRAATARELGPQPAQLLLGALDAALDLGSRVSLTAGTEMLWQRAPAQPSLPSVRFIAFTALSIGARNLL
jgi:hypothetical protein